MTTNAGLFESQRLRMDDAIALTIDSLRTHGERHRHWSIAWSGGKDSTALLTLTVHLIRSGEVPAPETLTVLYADTRMELTPLVIAAASIRNQLQTLHLPGVGLDVRTVMAPLDKRFFVYMLGRGVPPPNNNTFRWCTRQIKVEPMAAELARLFPQRGEKLLMLTGVRQGESAIRDGRIAMSCGRDGAECGQGWYQESLPDALCDTLAPMLHWRVCHVWDWLRIFAPSAEYGSWATGIIADAYGGDEAEEINARTGCIGCPLASRDTALDAVLARPEWSYLAPLKHLRPLYRELRLPHNRLRKSGGERRGDGSLVANQCRMGPLTIEAREMALSEVLSIQFSCNLLAAVTDRPAIDILNTEESARIRELIALRTWPQKWSGDEPRADELFEDVLPDGSIQRVLFPAEPVPAPQLETRNSPLETEGSK
jgi:DNA sulfur modification protein DndC